MNVVRSVPLIAGLMAALIDPTVVLAATANPPSGDTSLVASGPPWGLFIGVIAIAFGALALLRPWTRRWIAAGASVIAGGLAAFVVLFAGTLGGWSGRPPESWTVPGAVIVGVVGLVGALWIFRRGIRPALPLGLASAARAASNTAKRWRTRAA